MFGSFSKRSFLPLLLLSGLVAATTGQSLSDKLAEDESFYTNYAKDLYSRLRIEKDVIGRYDGFGEHITDGVQLYRLSNSNLRVNNQREREGEGDSVAYSSSVEFQKKDFYEKFSNLVITQDAVGGNKMAFLVGDQITTKFTPLTFNKTNFKGIRFDLWSTGLQFSGLLARPHPGVVSEKDTERKYSLVDYPADESSLPSHYYDRGLRGDRDFSNVSPYGDYEWLWALHAENNIANKVDVGLTYINHHRSNVKEGEKWFRGDIPRAWMPEEVHFEFYDNTPLDTTDAGVYVHDMRMFVNGKEVEARSQYVGRFRQVRIGEETGQLNIKELPTTQPLSGQLPIIVAFAIDPRFWQFKGTSQSLGSTRDIKDLSFKYSVAGNYLVFSSTDKQIPLAIGGKANLQTGEIYYEHPTKSIKDIYDEDLKRGASPKSIDSPEKLYSTTYFGEYIAKSVHPISVSASEFTSAAADGGAGIRKNPARYNYRHHDYRYAVNVSSQTLGLNFRGELAGTKFGGELALNLNQRMLPGNDDSRQNTAKWVGVLNAERALGKNFGIDGDVYYIAPQWRTSLGGLQTSRYFSKTTYTTTDDDQQGYYDYKKHPRPFTSGWNNIDDNDDNDAFVESDRRRYPSDLHAKDDRDKFYDDGTLKWQRNGEVLVEEMDLPTALHGGDRFHLAYDDPDGVIASKHDRNINGIPDYLEDFLLYSSDPPAFELGNDLNNNGIPDWEDDDILPDYGYSVGYVITSDGIVTQGIRGLRLNLRWFPPLSNTTIDFGATIEGINDRDLVLETVGADEGEAGTTEGRSLVGHITAKREILKRSQGIQYEIGNELRAVRDGIRNDAVKFRGSTFESSEEYDVTYLYYTDPLKFRQALVDNFAATVVYNNIPNFEYIARLKLGVQKHFSLTNDQPGTDGKFYNVYTLYDPTSLAHEYRGEWEDYPDRFVGDLHLVNRFQYRFTFDYEYDDWRRVFNALNRLEIVPQYKLGLSVNREISGPGSQDPRDLEANLRWFKGIDLTSSEDWDRKIDEYTWEKIDSARIEWYNYELFNSSYLLNVPIARVNYRIAENTKFELGVQWARYMDFLSPEKNARDLDVLAQIVSKANYKGHSVTFFLGARRSNTYYDVNVHNPVLGLGNQFDEKYYQFFAKIYSGT